MSILLMSQVWALDNLDPLEKLTLLSVADFANDEGIAWPSIRTIARKSSLSEDSVRRKLKNLQKSGLISITPQQDKNGRDTSNKFHITIKSYQRGETRCQLPLQTASLANSKGETRCQRGSYHEPSMNHQTPTSSFAAFWQAYPRKTGKAVALKTWNRLNPPPETVTAIMSALDWQHRQPEWLKENGRYIPHPSTWLNGRRWEDEQPGAAQPHQPARRLQVAL